MLSLSEQVGTEIVIRLKVHLEGLGLEFHAVLQDVEPGGIWILHPDLKRANRLLELTGSGERIGSDEGEHAPCLFLPYGSIECLLALPVWVKPSHPQTS